MTSKVESIPEEEFLQWKKLIYHVISKKFSWVFQHRKHFSGNPLGTNTITLDDLVQVGSIGLNRAWLTFNPSFGVTFKTYAFKGICLSINTWIHREKRFVRRTKRFIGMRVSTRELRTRLCGVEEKGQRCETGSAETLPTPIAVRTRLNDRDEQDNADTRMDYEVVRQKVIEIVGAERAEVLFRWTRGESHQKIADSEGVTREAVRQRINTIIRQVREIWEEAGRLSTT